MSGPRSTRPGADLYRAALIAGLVWAVAAAMAAGALASGAATGPGAGRSIPAAGEVRVSGVDAADVDTGQGKGRDRLPLAGGLSGE